MKIKRRRVVITGMGILSAHAENIPEFKNVLLSMDCSVKASKRYSKWFVNANASEIEQDIDYSDIRKDIVGFLDNAALWAYKVTSEALHVMVNKFCRRSKRHFLVHGIFDVALNNQSLNGVDNNCKTECNFQPHR